MRSQTSGLRVILRFATSHFVIVSLAILGQAGLGVAADKGSLAPELLSKVKRGTVMVHVKDASGTDMSGSGCLIAEPGVVLTNAHVLGMFDADSRPPQKIEVVIDSGEPASRTIEAKLLSVDRLADLAALRITGKNLPPPIPPANAALLRETEELYVFGFPFGKKLGTNITVTKSSVSSLRKENNQLEEIQLNGGINSGNSGGPVVNGEGQLVGIAVSAISGTSIGFAIPSEHVAGFLAGRLNDYGTDIAIREGDKIKILWHLNFVDPLGRIKNVRIEHYQGPRASLHSKSLQRPAPRKDETEVKTVEIPYKGEVSLSGELAVEPLQDPKFVYWLRPVFVDGAGREVFNRELSGMNATPVERRPQMMKFQPRAGVAPPMELTNKSAFRIRLPGGTESSKELLLKVLMNPEFKPASTKDPCRLLLKYNSFTIGMSKDGKSEKNEEEFGRIGRNVLQTSAVLDLDADGIPIKTSVSMGKAEESLHPLMTSLNEHMLQGLELFAVPNPNEEVQPLQTIRVQRNVTAGMPGLEVPAQADLKFKYQGMHDLRPKVPAAVWDFNGAVRARRGDKLNIGGEVFGRVEISPETGEILKAKANLKVDVDLPTEVGILRLTGSMFSELKPPPPPKAGESKPEKPPVLEPGDKRLTWIFKDQGTDKRSGSFKRNDEAIWTESNSVSGNATFEEWHRTAEYVVIYDPKRKIRLRIYDDHLEIRNNKGAWVPHYQGAWE